MEQNNIAKLNVVITGATSELRRETTHQLVARKHQVTGIIQYKKSTKNEPTKGFV